MARFLQVSAGTAVVLLLVGGPVVLAFREQAQTRTFRVVRAGVLYRSGQMTRAGLQRVFHEKGIRTVISLRDGTSSAEQAEETFCNSEEVTFVRIPPSRWGDIGGSVPMEEGVRTFKEVMGDPRNYPVLIHCFAGIHRTGAFTAIYRMEFEHWSNAEAMAEMRACGYTTLDEELDILGYMEQYRPAWRQAEEGPAPPASPPPGQPHARRGSGPVHHVCLKPRRATGEKAGKVAGGKREKVKGRARRAKGPGPGPSKSRSRRGRPAATPPGGAAARRGPGAA
jgi:predicted protein tyrosine phosphatase